MLKKIPVQQLSLGMHLHALEGGWLDHPFWRTRFTVTEPADLAKLHDSRVTQVWIDIGKGADVPSAPLALPMSAESQIPDLGATDVPSEPREPPRSLKEELHQARQICQSSAKAVSVMFSQTRLGHALDTGRCLPVVDDITRSVYRNPGALVSLARLKTRDDYSYMHSVAVCALMVALSAELGMDDAAAREAGLAGLLHDLGKSAIPLDVLNKPGRLSDDEFTVVRTHPQRGFEMLMEGGGTSAGVMDVCLHHHERLDGRGYPHGLAGERISPLARMGAVCDVYDAITSNRPYKAGWDPGESIARMASWHGHFDAHMFRAFVRSLGIYPTGSLVRLQSGRLAVVMAQNPQRLTAPLVKVFYSTRSQMPVSLLELDLAATGCQDKIVDREPVGKWNFPQLDELWAGEAAPKQH